MSYFLLEAPLPVIVTLLVLALVCWIVSRQVGTNQARRWWRIGVLACVGVMVMITVLAWAVTTPRERVEGRTRELVEVARFDDDADRERVEGFFTSDATLHLAGRPHAEREALMARLEGLAEQNPGGFEHTVRGVTASGVRGGEAKVLLELTTLMPDSAFAGQPMPTQWELTWTRGSDGMWRISRADWLRLGPAAPTGW